jgi:hypothetical protein
MKLKPIKISMWGLFTITFGTNWQKERLKELVIDAINWEGMEANIADETGPQIADVVTRYVKTYIINEVESIQEDN